MKIEGFKKAGRIALFQLLLCLVMILSACSLLPKEEPILAPPLVEPAQMQFSTAEVIRGDISRSVAAVGNFYPLKITNVFSEQNGRMKEIYVKHRDVVKKGDLLVQLDVGNLMEQIEDHEFALRRAEIELIRAKQNKGDEFSIELAEMNYDQERIRHNRLLERLEAARIYAPIDGMITYVTERKEGNVINQYESLVQIASVDELLLMHPTIMSTGERGSASRQINDVRLGMKAEIRLGNAGETLTGRVAQAPSSAPLDMPQESRDFFKDTIIIKADDLPESVQIGDLVDFTIVLEKKEDALLIPRGALRTFLGRDYVQVLDGANLKEVDVETGIVTSTQVEIRKGLQEGDLVIMK
jgi:macrolide-specific efflux system membrane fusion protein